MIGLLRSVGAAGLILSSTAAQRVHDARIPVIAIVADSSGTELTDFMVPRATLTEAGIAHVVTVALHAGAIRLVPGTITIVPDLTLAAFDSANPGGANYVIVPAMVDHDNPAIAAWLRSQAAHGATIMSICEGARTVAYAGLFEGRRATTHWSAMQTSRRSIRARRGCATNAMSLTSTSSRRPV